MNYFDTTGPAAELGQLSLAELSRRIKNREISCSEAVNGYLERIEAYDGADKLNAFITVAADEAGTRLARTPSLAVAAAHARK